MSTPSEPQHPRNDEDTTYEKEVETTHTKETETSTPVPAPDFPSGPEAQPEPDSDPGDAQPDSTEDDAAALAEEQTASIPMTEEKLREYQLSMRQEFLAHESAAPTKQNSKKLVLTVRDGLIELAPDALHTLQHIVKHKMHEQPALAFKASVWILDALLADKGLAKADDPMTLLLEEMADASKQPK